jgi:hypothetical protein
MGRDSETGVIVDQLEDHTLAATGQNVFGAIELPARVRCRINEPPVRGPRFLPGLDPGNADVTEDPRQRRRRRHRHHPEGSHLVVHADRPVIEAGLLERGANPDRLLLHFVGRPLRTRPRPSRARLKRCRLPLLESSPFDRVKRLPRDPLLRAESRHRTPWRIRRPLRNSKTDTRINRLNTTHPSSIKAEVSGPNTAERSEIY